MIDLKSCRIAIMLYTCSVAVMLASEIVAGSFVFDLAGSFPENKWSQKKEKAKNHKVDDDDVHLSTTSTL